jgi:hypothetical protein
MYSIKNAHYKFKNRANKVDGLRNSSFLVPQIDEYIWEGYIIWLEAICEDLEVNQKRRDDIRQLEEKNVELPVVKEDDYYVAFLPDNYYRYLESYSVVYTDTCPKKVIKNYFVQKDDIYQNDSMYNSSYGFERMNIDLSSNKMYIYSDDLKIDSVKLTYVRKPLRPGNPEDYVTGFYNLADGTQATQQDIEVDSTFQIEKILDIAVLVAMRDVGNTIDFESQLNKILKISKL